MAIPQIPSLKEMVEAGMHFGHASGKWHPKMKPYIFATRKKLHIINLEVTQDKMSEVLPKFEQRVRDGKAIVLVGTKPQASKLVKEIGEKLGVAYVDVRWLGGTMTNWVELQKSVTRMKDLDAFLASPDSAKVLKKERVVMESELARMTTKYGGLRGLARKPEVLFVFDLDHDKNAVKEARLQGAEIFAICDTNANPALADYMIPANDDAIKSVEMMVRLVEATIASGQKLVSVAAEEAPAEKPAKKAKAEAEVEVATETIEDVAVPELEVAE